MVMMLVVGGVLSVLILAFYMWRRGAGTKQSFSEEEIAAGVARWVLDRSSTLTVELSDAMGGPPARRSGSEQEVEAFALEFACEVVYLTMGAAVCAMIGSQDGGAGGRCERVASLVEGAVRSNGLPLGTHSVHEEAVKYWEALSDAGEPGFGCGELFSVRVAGRQDPRLYLTAGAAFMQAATSLKSALKALLAKSS